jgi:hypothetical protein
VTKPKDTEKQIKQALKSKAAATKVDANAEKLAKILKRAGSGNNK